MRSDRRLGALLVAVALTTAACAYGAGADGAVADQTPLISIDEPTGGSDTATTSSTGPADTASFAGADLRDGTATTTPEPPTTTTTTVEDDASTATTTTTAPAQDGDQEATVDTDVDLSELDQLLAELDREFADLDAALDTDEGDIEG